MRGRDRAGLGTGIPGEIVFVDRNGWDCGWHCSHCQKKAAFGSPLEEMSLPLAV